MAAFLEGHFLRGKGRVVFGRWDKVARNRATRAAILALCVFTFFSNPADCQWQEIRSIGLFEIWAQFPLAEVESELAPLLRLPEDLRRALWIETPPVSVVVQIFKSRAEYRQHLESFYPDVPFRRALYVQRQGRAVVLAYRSGELLTDLLHEGTHALLHQWLPVVPLWLDEGLAEYFEMPPGRRAFDHPHLETVRRELRWRMLVDLERLENLRDMSQMGGKEYRGSWAWVHFFLNGPPEVAEEFRAYLRNIQHGYPNGRLSERLAARFPELERMVKSHFRSWQP